MLHTHPDFIYELKIGIAALQRACYEVIEACVKIDYAIRLLDTTGVASSGKSDVIPTNTDGDTKHIGIGYSELLKDQPTTPFTPTTKPRTTKGDPLAELAAQLSPQDREKLISSLEGGNK